MEYPEEFKAAVKAVYPEWVGLHAALDNGSQMVGRYLDDSAERSLSNDRVLAATSLEEIQTVARRNQKTVQLYSQWLDIYLKKH